MGLVYRLEGYLLCSYLYICKFCAIYSFSATLSLALRDRGLLCSSSSVAVIGLLVRTLIVAECPQSQISFSGGHRQSVLSWRKTFLIMRSSSEWKLMIAMRPCVFKVSIRLGTACVMLSSSSFTAMRKAWKLRVAGSCCSRVLPTAFLTTSAS